jgi:serine/threonine-protein kinase
VSPSPSLKTFLLAKNQELSPIWSVHCNTPKPGSSEEQQAARTPSLESIDDARFVPGTIVAERYRIVGLLGRGGMGEVYRSDDLKMSHDQSLQTLSLSAY